MVVPREDNLVIENFNGLNVSSDPTLIDDRQFSFLQNLHFGRGGELVRRRGLRMESNLALKSGWTEGRRIQFLGTFSTGKVADPQYFVSVVWYIYLVDNFPYYGRDIVGAPVDEEDIHDIFGFPLDTICVGCVQYNDTLYFMTSNHGIWKVPIPNSIATGFTPTAIAGSPNSVAFTLFKDRLWVVQVTSANIPTGFPPNWSTSTALSSTIQFCDIANLDSWDAANIVKVAHGDGDVITNLVPYSDRILVFKKFSIWNMYLQGGEFPVSAVRLLTRSRGAISIQATVSVNDLIYFIAHDGVWRTDGSAFAELSASLSPLFTFGPTVIAYNQPDWIAYYDDHIYIRTATENVQATPLPLRSSDGIPESPAGYFYLVYNIPQDAWAQEFYPDGYFRLTRPVVARNSIGKLIFLQGAFDRVYSRQDDYWSDDIGGTPNSGANPVIQKSIPVTATTKRFEVDRLSRVKRLKYLVLGMIGVNCTPKFMYTVDGQDRDIIEFDPNSVNNTAAYKVLGCGYFRTFQLTITENSIQPFQVTFLNFIIHLKRQLAESPR